MGKLLPKDIRMKIHKPSLPISYALDKGGVLDAPMTDADCERVKQTLLAEEEQHYRRLARKFVRDYHKLKGSHHASSSDR